MSEQTLKHRERLARVVARQLGIKVCPRCHVGIVTDSGICDYCKDHSHNMKRDLSLRATLLK